MSVCTFIGHRECPQDIKDVLYTNIEKLIINFGVKVFYVGTQGRFDRYVYDTLCLLKTKYNVKIVVVLAYLKNNKDVYYDMSKTEFPYEVEKVPLRFAISKRNEYMIKQSQYLICYINSTFSNSYKFAKMAKKLNLEVINLGDLEI